MEEVDSGLVDLNWRERGDYSALDGLCERMTFDDALSLVFSAADVSKNDIKIDDLAGVVPGLVLMSEDSSLITERAGVWDALMRGLLTSDFPVPSEDVCTQLSRDLGVVSNSRAAEISGELDGVVSQTPEELSRFYRVMVLLVLLRERTVFKRVPYVEPRAGPELPDNLKQKLSQILSGPPILEGGRRVVGVNEVDTGDILLFNHDILQRYRRHFSEWGKYPIEGVLRQDPERMSEYCYALLRLVLGKDENFSEVLQESFVSEEVASLSQRYFPGRCGGRSLWDAEISNVVKQLRDLRVRAFEHNCLMTCRVPTSGVITPPGSLVGAEDKTAVDFGAGRYGRFFNAVARGNPGCDCFAVDKKVGRECDLSSYGSRNMHFVPGDFDDKSCVERLVSRFRGDVDMMNLSNILHKLKDPVGFLKAIFGRMLREHGGKVNVCMPAISSFADVSGRHVRRGSLAVLGYGDTTPFLESFLTIETFLDVIRSMSNMRIMSIALGDSRLSENDTAKRLFVALKKD